MNLTVEKDNELQGKLDWKLNRELYWKLSRKLFWKLHSSAKALNESYN